MYFLKIYEGKEFLSYFKFGFKIFVASQIFFVCDVSA